MAAKWRNNIKLKKYDKRVHAGIVAVCERNGQIMQNSARENAPWEDRTGNARGGLFYEVEAKYGRYVKLYLAHTMFYGVFLETIAGGKWAILWRTIEGHLGRLRRDLEAIFG